jgi:hypothetical protein
LRSQEISRFIGHPRVGELLDRLPQFVEIILVR